MSIFFNEFAKVGDKFGVNAVNSILSLFASDTAPTNPTTEQIWLDTSSGFVIKRFNGSTWDVVGSLPSDVAYNATTWNGNSGSASKNSIRDKVEAMVSDINSKEPSFSKNTAFNDNYGTAAGTVCQGNDTRLSNARTPVSHNNTYHSEEFITRDDLWRDSDTNETSNAFLQTGNKNCPVLNTWYSTAFDIAFTSAPKIATAVVQAGSGAEQATVGSITTTSFNLMRTYGTAGYTNWYALGRKD